MITSLNNGQVKNVIQLNQKAKARREQKLFAAEGRKMFLEAPPHFVEKVFVTESLQSDEVLMEQVLRYPYEIVADSVFRQMSDTQTPQGVLTILKKPEYTLEDIMKGTNPLLMVLEDLQDPGNLGTIFRTSEGAGVQGIIMTGGCVDITNPKVIRSTMGAIYRMPFVIVEDIEALAEQLRKNNIISYAAHLKGENAYDQEDYKKGTAFFIGNEGNGLTEKASAAASKWIRIPMCGKVESLNAAMAAGILSYEAFRQRRNG